MRRVGIERIFDQEQCQIGIPLVQGETNTLRGIAFAIVFLCAVLFEDRLEIQRKNFRCRRMYQHCRQPRVVIRNGAVAMRPRQATGTMHRVGMEMLDAIKRDNDELAPILVIADDTRTSQPLKTCVKERTQRRRIERIQNTAHLVVTRDGSGDPINATQITLFRHALLFEVEQRRSLERKQRKGTFQDIRQPVSGILRLMVWQRLKFSVHPLHQLVKV